MTPYSIRQQNAERRLRHSTWAREPISPIVWLFVAAVLSPFVAALAGALA